MSDPSQTTPDDALTSLGRVAGELVHDLANEVQVLEGWAMLARGEVQQGQAPLAEIQRVVDIAARMNAMLRDVLATASGRTVSPEVTFDPHALTESTVSQWVRELAALDVQLRSALPEGIRVAGPPSFWTRAVANLLVNAGRFAYRRIRLSLRAERDADARLQVVLRVEDDGPGVEPEERERIFHPLQRGEGGGAGLGLSSVAWSVAQLRGTVRYADDSSLGGAAFDVRVPAAGGFRLIENPAEVPFQSLAGLKLVMVDDDPHLRLAVGKLLQRYGADVRVIDPAGMPEEGLIEGIMAALPDVIVLDLNLGERGGLGLWHTLRNLMPQLSSRVVFLSGVIPGDALWNDAAATGQPVLSKPFDLHHLVRTLTRLRPDG